MRKIKIFLLLDILETKLNLKLTNNGMVNCKKCLHSH